MPRKRYTASQPRSMALNSMWAMAWMKAARPSSVPRPRRGSSRGCTRRGRGGRPGMAMGSGGGAPSSIASSPRAKACAAAKVAATLSSGEAASRQARAAVKREPVTSGDLCRRSDGSRDPAPATMSRLPSLLRTGRTAPIASRRQPAPLLRLVRTQLADALEVIWFDPGHVLAAEAGAVEAAAGELRPGDRGFEVGQDLVDQPVAAEQLLDLLLAAPVGDQFVDRRHVDAVDVRMAHRRRGRGQVDLARAGVA